MELCCVVTFAPRNEIRVVVKFLRSVVVAGFGVEKRQKIFKKDLAEWKWFSTFAPRYESNAVLKKKG